MPPVLTVEFTEPEMNIIARALEVFQEWCRAGNYTLTAEDWAAWQSLRPKLTPKAAEGS